MASDASTTSLPVVHDSLRFTDSNGKEFVLVSIPNIEHDHSGHPDDRGIMTKLRIALLAESYLAIEALCGFDVRALLSEKYDAEQLPNRDDRSATQRRQDAEDLVEAEHKQAKQYFKSLCNVDVGYDISYICRHGAEAVKKHYGKDKTPNLNKFMRQENRQYARDALPDASDEKLANIRLDVITALLTGWAKWEEMLFAKQQTEENTKNKKRGRPSKNPSTQNFKPISAFTYSLKVDCDDGEQLHLIAAHSGVNPVNLWTNAKECKEVFDYQIIFGKYARGILWSSEEIAFFDRKVARFMLGRKMPQTWQEDAVCRLIGWQLDKWDNTAKRKGRRTVFTDPAAVEDFRLGANLAYHNGEFIIDMSPLLQG
ncbi:MAG: hypothetical protein POH28_03410 [Acidocella sp.]|nr:hypothetical protein [Acidocella sp.]